MKEEDEHYTYEFSGWSPEGPIKGNTEYTPVFKAIGKPFSLIFKLEGGTWKDGTSGDLVLKEPYGTQVTVPEPGTRLGFRFLYWEGSRYYLGDRITVTENHTLKAVWEAVVKPDSRDSNSGKNKEKKPSTPADTVVTCQMAGYPAGYAWNEAAKACQPGFIDNAGVFHGTHGKGFVPNTYDRGLLGDTVSFLISLTTSIIALYLLKTY